MVELNDEPVKAPQSQNEPDEEEVKANPDPNPEDDISEENRLKMEADKQNK